MHPFDETLEQPSCRPRSARADDADDPNRRRPHRPHPERSADDVLPSECVEREVFVNHQDRFAVEPIVIVEEPALEQQETIDDRSGVS